MKAIGFTQHLNINDSRSLFEFEESIPVPKGPIYSSKLMLYPLIQLMLVYDVAGMAN